MTAGAVRELYKRVLWVGRAYPGAGGLSEVRRRAKQLFAQTPSGSDSAAVQAAFDKGVVLTNQLVIHYGYSSESQ